MPSQSGQGLSVKHARDSGDDDDTEEEKVRQASHKVSADIHPPKQGVLTKQKPRHDDALQWVELPLSQWASEEERMSDQADIS
jgi:hypothetical protein